jgi:hypothetical protein
MALISASFAWSNVVDGFLLNSAITAGVSRTGGEAPVAMIDLHCRKKAPVPAAFAPSIWPMSAMARPQSHVWVDNMRPRPLISSR